MWLLSCRAACAVMGFVGTWVGQALIRSIGLLRTGLCALLLQAGSLALAAIVYRWAHVTCQYDVPSAAMCTYELCAYHSIFWGRQVMSYYVPPISSCHLPAMSHSIHVLLSACTQRALLYT